VTFSTGGKFEGGRVRKGGGAKVAVGGGAGALLIVAVAYLLGGSDAANFVSGLTGGGSSGGDVGDGQAAYVESCTADQANTDRECRLNATVQSLDAYWQTALPQQSGVAYVQPPVVSYDGATSSPCGTASAATGPFYCPADQTIYIDVSFFDTLERDYGSSGGPLAEEYVVAHELGHHIENQLGVLSRAANDQGADSDSVRVELMADCLAGMWAGNAATTVDPDTGTTFLNPITDDQLRDALSAASAVGDDHIQEQATGQVNPEGFTHGTSDQRMRWFQTGYNGGTVESCNALDAQEL
jgi:predicted metalloprotease